MSKHPVKARLMDRLLEDRVLPPLPNRDMLLSERGIAAHTHKVRTALADATVIEATNVARFFDESYVEAQNPAAIWSDLKCVAPPHSKFFIEWEKPLVPALRMGVLFVATTPDTIIPVLRSLMGGALSMTEAQRMRDAVGVEGARWIYLTLSFLEFAVSRDHVSNLRGPYHIGSASVASDGALLSFNLLQNNNNANLPRDEELLIGAASMVAWTALAMMNCENINTVIAAPPAAFQKARTKRGKKPFVSYHTVRVDMTKTPRSIGRAPLPGDGDMRLHEKRGHMKDYRKGKGLFGKYKGLWYWGPQLAGAESEGVVISDYQINQVKEQ